MAQPFEYNLRRASEILRQIMYITIASVSDSGQPWNSPVYAAFDEELNFYWTSDKNSQHSQNVRANSKAYLVIYDSTMAEGTGEAVYLLAEAHELSDIEELKIARNITQERKDKHAAADEYVQFTGDKVRRIYKATPQRIWMNDVEEDEAGQYIRDIRVEIPIDKLKKQLGLIK